MDGKYKVILFDLGGVLIELAGMPTMMAWTRHTLSPEEFWKRWLASPAVREFESGKSTPESFSETLIGEFDLPVAPDAFLTQFLQWPRDTFPGTGPLLQKLSGAYLLGTLSNTNALHWERFNREMDFMGYFDHHFPSHLTGLLKPDQEAFTHAIRILGVEAADILFFDDNRINVHGARAAGMHAHRVAGLVELESALATLGLLTQSADP